MYFVCVCECAIDCVVCVYLCMLEVEQTLLFLVLVFICLHLMSISMR